MPPAAVTERRGTFHFEGHELAYTEFGDGPRVVVLTHGLLLNQRMQLRLARALARRGNRAITLDLLGHGESDRPADPAEYSMEAFGRQIVALLDHLAVDDAVLLGTSLGANATLEVALAAPERVRGMVVEMPVLDNALIASALVFTPLMVSLTFAEPLMRLTQAWAQLIPRDRLPLLADIVLDTVRQDPQPSAAVVQGLFFGRVAPHRRDRRRMAAPTLVIGHQRDPVHPFSDAGELAEELPDGRLLEASSIIELRLTPERLTGEIAAFVDECWKPRTASPRRAPGRSGTPRRRSVP